MATTQTSLNTRRELDQAGILPNSHGEASRAGNTISGYDEPQGETVEFTLDGPPLCGDKGLSERDSDLAKLALGVWHEQATVTPEAAVLYAISLTQADFPPHLETLPHMQAITNAVYDSIATYYSLAETGGEFAFGAPYEVSAWDNRGRRTRAVKVKARSPQDAMAAAGNLSRDII